MHVLLHAVLVELLHGHLLIMIDVQRANGVDMDAALKAHEFMWSDIGFRVQDRPGAAVADDCLFVLPGATVRGVANARPYFAAYLTAYPDSVKSVQHVVRDDQTVVVRSTVQGHNTGSLVTATARAEPTGNEVEWDIVEWLVVKDGVIVEWRVYQDSTPFIDVLNNLGTDVERAARLAAGPCLANVVVSERFDRPATG